ncbi:hypothetical protein AGMMS49944_17590 [Spirochaetia bacterium]|nr:hypothetical protein AGMMS49944_17590 [Spirochaetia bacterium]
MQSLSGKKLCSSSGLKATGFGPNLRFLITLIAALALADCDIASDITTPAAPATDSTAPAEVGNLNAAAGNAQVVLTWTDPADSDFRSVKITQPDSSVQWLVPKGTQTIPITGLTDNTQYTFTVKTVDTVGNESAGITATASTAQPISLSETGNYIFPAATVGYGAQTARTVTVTNTGNQATGALTASLTGADSTSFTLSRTNISSIAAGGAGTFTVVPNTALAVRTSPYTATVTVSGGNGITVSFTVSFTVNSSSPTYSIGLSETFYAFPAVTEGYGAQAARIVTITNTGNQEAGDLTFSLGGPNREAFYYSTNGAIRNIAVGGTGSLNIFPANHISVGTYTATLTISGSNGIRASFTVGFTVNHAPTFELSETGTYTFPGATVGYGGQTTRTVFVYNTGNQGTGALTVSLTGADSTSFTLSTTNISNIVAGGTGSFKVLPKTALAAKTHTATVTVSGGNGITASFPVSFTVNPAPTYGIRLSETGTYTFRTVETRTVTVTNTGNQATGALTVSLTGANSTSFTSSRTGISSIAKGGSAEFTVVPNTPLVAKTSPYTATVTVSGGNGITASFSVSFTVNQDSSTYYGINLSETGRLDWGKISKYNNEQPYVTVVITNTGNQPTGRLTATTNDDLVFVTSTYQSTTVQLMYIPSIRVGGTASFTVYARDPYPSTDWFKWYISKVRVSGDNGITAEFEIRYNWDYF